MTEQILEVLEIIKNGCINNGCRKCEFWNEWTGCWFDGKLPMEWDLNELR